MCYGLVVLLIFKFINMSTIGKVMAMAGIAAAMSESNYMLNEKKHIRVNFNPEPEWKRKKCKTCSNCGSNCQPYNYKGRILFRYSKPTSNACEKYSFRKK